jgi:hypothetical protein
MDEDPVIDFKIMEAVAAKVNQEQEKALKEQEKKNWRGDRDDLKQFA